MRQTPLREWQCRDGEKRLVQTSSPTAPKLCPGRLSVVIGTYARPEPLGQLLTQLGACAEHFQELIVVDSSPDPTAENQVLAAAQGSLKRHRVVFVAVPEAARGIPVQRNLGLERVSGEFVLFLDDDVRLDAVCLTRLHECLATHPDCAGVGAVVSNEVRPRDRFWALFHALGGVDSLTPGHVARSGFAVPLAFVPPRASGCIEVGRLPGCAMMWRSAVAWEVRFDERLHGYALGEDLDFSQRARSHGPLLLVLDAQVIHQRAASGRPSGLQLARMRLVHQHLLYLRALRGTITDDVRHWYAMLLYAALLLLGLAARGRWRAARDHLFGSVAGLRELLRRRQP